MKTEKEIKLPINRSRKKLLEAMVFFAQKGKIKSLGKTKMFKLLAFADFEHFKEVGLPIFNDIYIVKKHGPVPRKLSKELGYGEKINIPEDFQDSLFVDDYKFTNKDGKECYGFTYISKRSANLKIFSPRQIEILNKIAEIFKEANTQDTSAASHEYNQPWMLTKEKKGMNEEIDLIETIAVDGLSKDYLLFLKEERDAMEYNYGRYEI